MERTHCFAPHRLAFANHVNGFVTGNRPPGAPKGTEMLSGVDPSLDRTVVLFQNVIEVGYRPMPAILLKNTFGFEPHDRGRVRTVTVGVDKTRQGMVLPSPTLWPGSALLRPHPA